MTDHPKRIANLLNGTSTPMAGRLRYRLFEPPGARASVPRLWGVPEGSAALVGPVGDGAGRWLALAIVGVMFACR